jgi:pseudaminic acid biosynthesis-associated methylase
MNSRTPNDQEQFWAGDFGDAYVDRNSNDDDVAYRIGMFAKALAHTKGIESVLELGANIGLNLRALRTLLPRAALSGVEINRKAWSALRRIDGVNAVLGSLLDVDMTDYADLSLCSGVLIHIAPDSLARAYEKLFHASRRYVLLVEYYNPTPVEVSYRGHAERLFKRDFAGEMVDRFPLKLVDYGFIYRRDPIFPADDVTWFLMEKGAR